MVDDLALFLRGRAAPLAPYSSVAAGPPLHCDNYRRNTGHYLGTLEVTRNVNLFCPAYSDVASYNTLGEERRLRKVGDSEVARLHPG